MRNPGLVPKNGKRQNKKEEIKGSCVRSKKVGKEENE